tara:strand:+ start:254 stop:874 length:621 start_codon:yes stop_codon:yes gene_type:complete
VKKFKNFKIQKLKKVIKKDSNKIINLILKENPSSILASLEKNFINEYLNKIAKSKNALLYVIRCNNKIVGYAIIAKKMEALVSHFSNIKMKLIFSMIKRFQIYSLLNAIISYLKIDIIFLEKKFKRMIKLNYNLNLLAIDKKFQSKGLGTFFLKNIFKNIKKTKYVTVEAVESAATKFYVLKHNFKLAGNKLRLPKKQSILYKKII